jgi:hypothetical protein
MRLLFKSLTWLLLLVLLTILAGAALLFRDSRPLVPRDRALTEAEVSWAKGWLRQANPRGLHDGALVTLILSEQEANVLGNYLIDQIGTGRASVRLEKGLARLAVSLGLPWDPRDSFVNLQLKVVATQDRPRIEEARLAGLPLPEGLVEALTARLTEALDKSRLALHLDLAPDLALVSYEWHREAFEQVGSGLVSPEERARLLHYQEQLVRYGAGRPKGQDLVLPDLISHLLTQAHDQSDADPAAENRAAILALTAYVNRRAIREPVVMDVKAPAFRPVVLRGRRDLSQHFMTSAALAAHGGNALADLIGLFKEVSDATGGSGFSFADLAADRAGTRFAELATGDIKGARRIQVLAQRGLTEADIMPSVDGLREGISKAEFAATFGDTRSDTYRRVRDQIERRIDGLALFQTMGR